MVEFPDLHELPDGHPPSPYGNRLPVVKFGEGTLPPGLTVRAIGWIEKPGFPTGAIPDECIRALIDATPQTIFADGTRGIHHCELCHEMRPSVRWQRQEIPLVCTGHYLIQNGDIVYMAPALLLHYIIDHEYRPPEEFLKALVDGRFLTQQDLVVSWHVPDATMSHNQAMQRSGKRLVGNGQSTSRPLIASVTSSRALAPSTHTYSGTARETTELRDETRPNRPPARCPSLAG